MAKCIYAKSKSGKCKGPIRLRSCGPAKLVSCLLHFNVLLTYLGYSTDVVRDTIEVKKKRKSKFRLGQVVRDGKFYFKVLEVSKPEKNFEFCYRLERWGAWIGESQLKPLIAKEMRRG